MTVKDLENYVLLAEQRIEGKIKSHSRWWLIGAGVAVVLVIILLVTVFKGKDYTGDIQTLDSVIKYQQKTIESLQRFNDQQDSVINNLNEAYKKNRPTETRIIREYEKIPDRVRSLTKDSLRRAVSEFE